MGLYDKQYVKIDFDQLEKLEKEYERPVHKLFSNGLLVLIDGRIYGKNSLCEDVNEFYVIEPYLNKFKYSKKGYWKFNYMGKIYRRYRLLAECFIEIPQELYPLLGTRNLSVDHIDNDSTNDDITNLQWMSLSDNSKKAQHPWTEDRRKAYGEAVRKAHAEGKYDQHMKNLHNRKDK